MSPDRTQLLTVLMIVAVAPVVWFALDRSAAIVGLSVVCVALVTGSLYLMFGPTESQKLGKTA
jgi:hypothetical protein